MAWRLVVETESVPGVADVVHPGLHTNPPPLAALYRGERPLLLIDRFHGVARQQVFHVGQDELLMLLFVMQSELDERSDLRRQSLIRQQFEHRLIYVPAICEHGVESRPRQHAPLASGMPLADRVVIGVEKNAIRSIEGTIPPVVRREHERLEEPRGMRE